MKTKFNMSKVAFKRNKLKNSLCVICTILSFLSSSCDKNEISLPTVSTKPVTNIATITATSGGHILIDGDNAIVKSGASLLTIIVTMNFQVL